MLVTRLNALMCECCLCYYKRRRLLRASYSLSRDGGVLQNLRRLQVRREAVSGRTIGSAGEVASLVEPAGQKFRERAFLFPGLLVPGIVPRRRGLHILPFLLAAGRLQLRMLLGVRCKTGSQ